MPTVNKVILIQATGDSAQILETSAMTQGAYVRSRLVFRPGPLKPVLHVHPRQDETYEVLSGKLTYVLNGKTLIAEAGATVKLPRGVPHRHHCEGPEETVAIQTVSPGLDFDYLLENVFGLADEGRLIGGRVPIMQGLAWVRGLKGPITVPRLPLGVQKLAASLLAPLVYLFGYRAVYKRFSGEEW